jgi:hypothetical protein
MKRSTQIVLLTTKAAAAALKAIAKKTGTSQQALLRQALIDLGKKHSKEIQP